MKKEEMMKEIKDRQTEGDDDDDKRQKLKKKGITLIES